LTWIDVEALRQPSGRIVILPALAIDDLDAVGRVEDGLSLPCRACICGRRPADPFPRDKGFGGGLLAGMNGFLGDADDARSRAVRHGGRAGAQTLIGPSRRGLVSPRRREDLLWRPHSGRPSMKARTRA